MLAGLFAVVAQVSTAATDRAVTLMQQSVSERVRCRYRVVAAKSTPRSADFALVTSGDATLDLLAQRRRGFHASSSPAAASSARKAPAVSWRWASRDPLVSTKPSPNSLKVPAFAKAMN